MKEERIEKKLLFINSTPNPQKNQYSILTFEDENGDKYEYNFVGTTNENSKNKFYQNSLPYQYFPLLHKKKAKKYINISFRKGKTRYNPLTGKYIHQILYPIFGDVANS